MSKRSRTTASLVVSSPLTSAMASLARKACRRADAKTAS
jgi:hypothetical protein